MLPLKSANQQLPPRKELGEYHTTVWDWENTDALGGSNMRSFTILNHVKIGMPGNMKHSNSPGSLGILLLHPVLQTEGPSF